MIRLPTRTPPRVSIVIVSARRADRLLECLAQVARKPPAGVALQTVVVLNAAEPALHDALATGVEGAEVVVSEVPLGFAGGVNLGARHAVGELLHVLHDDTRVCTGWLEPLVAALEAHPEAAAVGSRVLNLDGTLQSAGHVLWREGRTEPIREAALPDAAGGPYPVDYCGSASLLVRSEAWQAIGGLDEDYHPAYFVDVDLALSLREWGRLVLCEPRSRVLHARGGSSCEGFRHFVTERNRELLRAKWAAALARQEPYADDPDAHVRARRATEREAERVAAADRSPRPPREHPRPESEGQRLRRERLQLRRDLAVKEAYLETVEQARAALEVELDGALRARAELGAPHQAQGTALAAAQSDLDAARREREALHGECAALARDRDALADELAAFRRERDWLRGQLEAVQSERSWLQQRLGAADAELEWLRECARTLAAIEAGGWWRLRTRLRPVLRVGGRLRRVSRRAGTNRTG